MQPISWKIREVPCPQKYCGTLHKQLSTKWSCQHPKCTHTLKPDLMIRCKDLETQQGSDSVKLKALRANIGNPTSKHDVQVSQETNRMFKTAISEELLNGIENKYLGTPEQQKQRANCKTVNVMRCPPPVIRWCLGMRGLKTSRYDFLEPTTSLTLSSLLNDYAQYKECGTWINYMQELQRWYDSMVIAI